jgi:hypothetical protein
MTEAARFDPAALARLREAREVVIVTESLGGVRHRTIIWVAVDGHGRVLVRSYRGADARWYREATSGRPVALRLDGEEHRVAVVLATDVASVAACSEALEAKYAGDPATPAMLREEILGTTLELTPLGDE